MKYRYVLTSPLHTMPPQHHRGSKVQRWPYANADSVEEERTECALGRGPIPPLDFSAQTTIGVNLKDLCTWEVKLTISTLQSKTAMRLDEPLKFVHLRPDD